jgi:two-component system cell cycle response regulator
MSARILLIEDDEAALDLMGYLLNYAGHRTVAARDGELGLIKVLHGDFDVDLVLCDIGLPGLDGYEVLRRLRESGFRTDVPIVAVTGQDGGGPDGRRFLGAGFSGYVGKPIDPNRFVDTVESFLPESLRGHG